MTETIQPPRDKAEQTERFQLVLGDCQIHADRWDQDVPGHSLCGTSHCVGGFAHLRALGLGPTDGLPDGVNRWNALRDASRWLGIKNDRDFYDVGNSLDDLRRIANEIIASE